MICKECRTGADISVKGPPEIMIPVKASYHNRCKGGTHCDCQHRVGRKNTQ